MEIWKNVKGFGGKYQISNFGRLKSVRICKKGSLAFVKERILKGKTDKDGYIEYGLYDNENKKNRYFRAHRLVAEAFIPNPKNLPLINHKDEVRDNNNVSNLEWCTPEYNARYSLSRSVLQIDINGNIVKEWESATEASKCGFDRSTIRKCCRGVKHFNSHKGFIWKYKENVS